MNQDDIILLGELLDRVVETFDLYENEKQLVEKAKIVSHQAKASKDYQELMDKLNNDLSEIGKDDKDAKTKEN